MSSRTPGAGGTDSDEYVTAEQVLPIRIPLEKVDIGILKYVAVEDGDIFDIELLYEMHTSEISIRSSIPSSNDTAGPGTLRIRGIKAATLDLVNEIPGTLEGIMARLVLEVDQDIEFEHKVISQVYRDNERKTIFTELDRELKCRRVVLKTSVHETGHLRDVLLFLKSDDKKIMEYFKSDDRNLYVNQLQRQASFNTSTDDNYSSLTFLEIIPWWSIHLPWWIYSRKLRKLIQWSLFLYTVFTIMWASWQLYRHVNVIQTVLEPLVKMLKWYLSDVMDGLDYLLDYFTHYWTSLLSPLNVFRSILLLPVWKLLLQLKTVVIPLKALMMPFMRCFAPLSRCLAIVWQAIIDSKLAVQSIDIGKLQQSFVFNLIFSCLRSFFNCIAKLIGYSKTKSRQIQAMKDKTKMYKSVSSPSTITSPSKRYRESFDSVPIYYNSPVVKENK